MNWTWLGLAVLVLLAFSMVDGYRHGFVKEVVSALLVLISVALVWLINPYVNQFIRENTSVYEKIQTASGTEGVDQQYGYSGSPPEGDNRK